MDNVEFTLQLGIPKEYPRQLPDRRSRCHNSDGLNQCDCHLLFARDRHECCFYGRPIEPLAFYLPPFSHVDQQDQCPLYTVLPQEIRDLVWKYTLADNGIPSPNCDNMFSMGRSSKAYIAIGETDVAHALLQTCKAVYLGTYRLPMLLNGYLSYRLNGPSRPDLQRIAPWQYALIQRLDLCLKQMQLEDRNLSRKLQRWQPMLRRSGAYVAPRYYGLREVRRPTNVEPTNNFGLIAPFEGDVHELNDGDKVILPQEYRVYDSEHRPLIIKSNFTARAMVARVLTRLTLRMSRTDWWTWSDIPNTTDGDKQLALDPACGDWRVRPSVALMLALAAYRRKGQHPNYSEKTWEAAIGTLQDLKSLELILETFSVKKHQLETVVECAQTWKFPLEDTQYELAYDGKMESTQWAQAAEDSSSVADSEPRDMNVDLDDGAGPSGEQTEADESYYEDSGSNRGSLHTDQETLGGDQEVEDIFNEDGSPGPVYEPEDWTTVEQYEYNDSLDGTIPVSPRYDPGTDSDGLESLPDEPWMRTAAEFEVRVVRFTRRRIS